MLSPDQLDDGGKETEYNERYFQKYMGQKFVSKFAVSTLVIITQLQEMSKIRTPFVFKNP